MQAQSRGKTHEVQLSALCALKEFVLEDREMKSAIESVLFIAGGPLSVDKITNLFEDATQERVGAQLAALAEEYDGRGAGIMLAEVAGGFQLATRPENAAWIRKFRSVKVSAKLSRPALETLAIVAYKQPITRTEVEAVRGVNIGGIMRNLMERRLVKIVGKKDVPGKPMMYGTTPEFLQYFGLKDLSSLPTLKEFQELEAGEDVMEEVPVSGEGTSSSGEDARSDEDARGSARENVLAPDPPEPSVAETEENAAETAITDTPQENEPG